MTVCKSMSNENFVVKKSWMKRWILGVLICTGMMSVGAFLIGLSWNG